MKKTFFLALTLSLVAACAGRDRDRDPCADARLEIDSPPPLVPGESAKATAMVLPFNCEPDGFQKEIEFHADAPGTYRVPVDAGALHGEAIFVVVGSLDPAALDRVTEVDTDAECSDVEVANGFVLCVH